MMLIGASASTAPRRMSASVRVCSSAFGEAVGKAVALGDLGQAALAQRLDHLLEPDLRLVQLGGDLAHPVLAPDAGGATILAQIGPR